MPFWLLFLVTGSAAAFQEEPLSPPTDRLVLGGWVGALYQDGNLPNQESFFNISALYLNGRLKLSDSWVLFAEVELENQPDHLGESETNILLERGYLEYEWSEILKLRLGKFNTQAGIIKPLHWDFTIDTIDLPIMEANSYFPAQSVGLELLGTRILKKGTLGYSFALSHSEDEVADTEPIDDAAGAGVDLHYERLDQFRVGMSAFVYQDPKDDDRTAKPIQLYFEWFFFDARLLWRTEFLNLQRTHSDDINTGYSKLRFELTRKLYLNYRFDRGGDERYSTGKSHTQHTLTLGLRPTNQIRAKLEYTLDQLPVEGDFDRWAAWLGWLFK